MIDNCVVDDLYVSHMWNSGMWSCRDAGYRAVENDIVPDNSVGNHLDTFAGVPDNVALDDVDSFTTAVHENAGVFGADIRIVDDVVTDDVPVRTEFYFDAVVASAAGAAGVVNVRVEVLRKDGDF